MQYIPTLLILILFAQLCPKEARDLAGQVAVAAVLIGALAAIGGLVALCVNLASSVPSDTLAGVGLAAAWCIAMAWGFGRGRPDSRRNRRPGC